MATERLGGGQCECNRPTGQCIKGDGDHCPAWDDDPEMASCPRCMGDGSVDCHCGGDLCVCENYGEAPCPVCHGEGEVTHERHDRYMAAQAESARAFHEMFSKD